MIEQTVILNRSVIFTEITGSPKLPAGTRVTLKLEDVGPCDVVALTPTGTRYEFKSVHIRNFIKTPWVDVASSPDVLPVAPPPAPPAPPAVNPFTIGDVASVEEGLANDTLAPLDVTGSSATENHVLAPKETVAETEAVEIEVDAAPVEASAVEEAPAVEAEASTAKKAETKPQGKKKK
jgi:hypothetical protein